jgi:hypothetical protein
LTIGLDWGDATHTVCVVDATGVLHRQFEVCHSAAGI